MLGFIRIKITKQRHQFTDMSFFFITDITENSNCHRVIRCLNVRVVAINSVKFPGYVSANCLDQFAFCHFAFNIRRKRITKCHNFPLFPLIQRVVRRFVFRLKKLIKTTQSLSDTITLIDTYDEA